MAQNVFMAQTCFLIPLRKLGKTYRKRFAKGFGQQINHSFCAKKDEMLCQYISMDKHDFFFKSFLYDSLYSVFHKVMAEAFVFFSRLSQAKPSRTGIIPRSIRYGGYVLLPVVRKMCVRQCFSLY